MNVHNLMEDIVSKEVNILYNQSVEKNVPWLTCDCENCRIDTISYVLNRVPAKYVVSGRGITHSTETFNDKQLAADVQTIALEGMKIVSSTKRPFHKATKPEAKPAKDTPAFNFPTITGTVLDGSTFEPLTGARLELTCNGEVSEMIDHTFSNPYELCKQAKGVFCFWPKSITTKKANVTKTFQMKLEVTAPEYTPLTHYFEITLKSDGKIQSTLDSNYSIKIKEFVLFKEDIVNEMDF